MAGFGNKSFFLSAFQPQLAFVSPLMQVANTGRYQGTGERFPYAVIRGDLGSIRGKRESRVGTQVGGDFLRLGLVDVEPVRQQRRVRGFKPVANLLPAKTSLLGRGKQSV